MRLKFGAEGVYEPPYLVNIDELIGEEGPYSCVGAMYIDDHISYLIYISSSYDGHSGDGFIISDHILHTIYAHHCRWVRDFKVRLADVDSPEMDEEFYREILDEA